MFRIRIQKRKFLRIKPLHQTVAIFPDCRTGQNTSERLDDAALGAFLIFFTQSPSFLSYQKDMQESIGKNNATNLFGVEEIFSENHIRNLLDVCLQIIYSLHQLKDDKDALEVNWFELVIKGKI